MTLLQAAILGVVEGITEFLPVSSTGHLLLAQHLMGIEGAEGGAFAIVIQAGAIAAVIGEYPHRFRSVLAGVTGGDVAGRRLLTLLVLAFAPAAVIGLAFDDAVEALLVGLWPVVVAWFVGGVAIWAVSGRYGGQSLESLNWRQAVAIGLAQCLALWPGTSRSLVTILAAGWLGLSLPAAVEFSFLLGFVTLSAATVYSALKHGSELLAAYGPEAIGVAFISAWISAALSIRWLVGWLSHHGLGVFAVWRIGLALAVGGWLLAR